MSYGFFTDKTIKPSEKEITEILSVNYSLWEDIVKYINENYKTKSEYKFYGKNYGWALRFNKSGKSFTALYPDKNEFSAQIILNKEQIDKALTSELSKSVKDIINLTHYVHEGKWIFIKIKDKNDLDDIIILLKIREK